MTTNRKSHKSHLEKTQLNIIAEEQELKPYKQSGDNIASILRRRALLPNPGLVLKTSRGKIPVKKTKSTLPCHNSLTESLADSESIKCPPFLKREVDKAPLRAQSVQNISKIPSSGNHGSTNRVTVGKKKCTEDNIKRAFSAQNVATSNLTVKSSKQNLSSKAYNAELLMKFDEEKKALEARISELIQLTERTQNELENMRKERAVEMESHRRSIENDQQMRAELHRVEVENEALRKQLMENGITVEHFTDTEKLFLIGSINPDLADVSATESTCDLRVSTDDLNAIAQRYMLSTRDDMSNSNLDRHNSMSVDRGLNAVSIADLTDRFLQMQESQHSVNEELQATLQELSDLQENVNELNEANNILRSDNDILLESLCGTSEKLNNARIQVENLKTLLIRDIERCSSNRNERELHLADLLKCAQQEKEELLLKQSEYLNVINSLEVKTKEMRDAVAILKESLHLQEDKNKALKDENSGLEFRLEQLLKHQTGLNGWDAPDVSTMSSSSIAKLNSLLRQKEVELERMAQVHIETVRELKQQNEFLKEKILLQTQHNKELDRELKAASASLRQSKAELSGCKKNLTDEREEWAQFQSDLLTAVVVANNLNVEKDNELKRLGSERKSLQAKYETLIEHISSKEFLEGQISLETLLGCHGEENGDHLGDGTELLPNNVLSPAVIKDSIRSSKDLIISTQNELGSHPLQIEHDIASPVNVIPEGLHPIIHASNAFPGIASEEVSNGKINGILVKSLNGDRREEKDKSSASNSSLLSSSSYLTQTLRSDPLLGLMKTGGSKRNALLMWCQNQLKDFDGIEVTNFSSSWNDGMALCALLHTYLPHDIPYSNLGNLNVKQRFECAFKAAKDKGLELGSEEDLNDLVATDRPSWQMVYGLVTKIYKHFEVESMHLSLHWR